MPHPLSKFADLESLQIQGMVTHAQRMYPYLEISSMDGVISLCRLMISSVFMLDTKPTAVRASFDFLRTIAGQGAEGEKRPVLFGERDVVFVIKMFGLRIRVSKGLLQFVPNNELDDKEDEEFLISDNKSAKELEFNISDVHKRTKIHTHTIQSAVNKLLREWRELQLAHLFATKVLQEKWTIGQAREYLRTQCEVKDHEFVRIRAQAIELGLFKSRRNLAKVNRRITLEEDNVGYVEEMSKRFGGRNVLTMSQTANRLIRDFRTMMETTPGSSKAK